MCISTGEFTGVRDVPVPSLYGLSGTVRPPLYQLRGTGTLTLWTGWHCTPTLWTEWYRTLTLWIGGTVPHFSGRKVKNLQSSK